MWDVVRWINAFLAFGSFGLMLFELIRRWPVLHRRKKRTHPWFTAMYAAVAYASAEAAQAEPAPKPGLRVLVTLVVLSGSAAALLMNVFEPVDHDPEESPRS